MQFDASYLRLTGKKLLKHYVVVLSLKKDSEIEWGGIRGRWMLDVGCWMVDRD